MEKNNLKQTVLITGGSSGIGLALAEKFLSNNFNVVITGRNLTKLEQVKKEHPSIYIEQSDVCKDHDVKALVLKMEQTFGGIDILFNNAGIMNLMDSGNELEEIERQFSEIEINVQAPIRLLHYFLPQLKKSKNGTIINTSSGLAFVPFAQAPTYSGTKAALHFWTMGIRPQLKLHKIRVVELMPPVVDTPMAHRADIASDDNLKPMPAEKLAQIFWKEFNKGNDEITPGFSKLLKLMSRIAPRFMFNQLNKQPIPKSN